LNFLYFFRKNKLKNDAHVPMAATCQRKRLFHINEPTCTCVDGFVVPTAKVVVPRPRSTRGQVPTADVGTS
jgi:hypothetical protein